MKIVHSWLADVLPGVGDDTEAIAATLTDVGLAVDDVLTVGATVPGVITARVLRTESHPEAAKIHRVFVDAGDGAERHVWCGAFNMQAGDVIPLATPGTRMPDGRVIEPKPILSIASDGMLCSARELGLGDDHTGIMILPADTPLGVPYGEAMGLRPEVVYDLDVTRNLPDCFGHRGVARQLGARLALAPTDPAQPVQAAGGRAASVVIESPERCTRFAATVISGVRVCQSPDWIASRLTAAGMRPINNVVDVSNYVMLELNQPNHAYDLETLGGGGFVIRLAADGETMITLDGVTRSVTSDDLLICDAHGTPIGIAGLMGGLHSEISDATTVIALEVAHFAPIPIATSARRLGLRSEASMRFERGVDPHGMPGAAARFVELLSLTCPHLVVETVTDEICPTLAQPVTVTTSAAAINGVLGSNLTAGEMAAFLRPLGFTAETDDAGGSGEALTVVAPTWRPDVQLPVDVAEEVGRQYGYDKVGKRLPTSTMHGRLSPVQVRRRRVRQVLLGAGISEAMPSPFLADDDLDRAGLAGDVVRIVNSLVADESVLRTSLRPGLLKAVAFNASHRRPGVSLFEIGRVYPPGAGHDRELPDEHEVLAVVLAGRQAPDAVALWRELATSMGFGARLDQGTVPPGTHPTRSATLSLGKQHIGVVGEVHPAVTEAFGIDERVAILELNLSVLLAAEPKVAQWKPTSRFPSSDLDLAFVTPSTVPAERVDKAIRQGAGALLVDLALFDTYRGAGVPEGARSLAYRLRLQATDRTLTDADVAAVRTKVTEATAKLGAALRG